MVESFSQLHQFNKVHENQCPDLSAKLFWGKHRAECLLLDQTHTTAISLASVLLGPRRETKQFMETLKLWNSLLLLNPLKF